MFFFIYYVNLQKYHHVHSEHDFIQGKFLQIMYHKSEFLFAFFSASVN
jgi:hypothetical protein